MNFDFISTSQEKSLMSAGIIKLKEKLDSRKLLWEKLNIDQRRKLIKLDKDPILSAALDMFRYLKNNFFGLEDMDV